MAEMLTKRKGLPDRRMAEMITKRKGLPDRRMAEMITKRKGREKKDRLKRLVNNSWILPEQ